MTVRFHGWFVGEPVTRLNPVFHAGELVRILFLPRYNSRRGIMQANAFLKQKLVLFWDRFGGKKTKGVGFSNQEKISALVAMADLVIPYHKQKALTQRRVEFNETKRTLHPWKRFGFCFVCGEQGTARHHIVQLKNGGINSRKNIVSLCDSCHAEIHPWLKTVNNSTQR